MPSDAPLDAHADDEIVAPPDHAVPNDVTIVRAIKTPYHLTGPAKNRLRPAAFRPPPGSNEVSVVRQDHGGDDYCKQVGSEKLGEGYKGLAGGLVSATIGAGAASVLDSPEGNYPGHADIIAPRTVPPKGEVLAAEDAKALTDFCDKLVQAYAYQEDPDLSSREWLGNPLAR